MAVGACGWESFELRQGSLVLLDAPFQERDRLSDGIWHEGPPLFDDD